MNRFEELPALIGGFLEPAKPESRADTGKEIAILLMVEPWMLKYRGLPNAPGSYEVNCKANGSTSQRRCFLLLFTLVPPGKKPDKINGKIG